jgi:hypothetical protein
MINKNYVKELDKNINNLTKCRNSNEISKPQNLTLYQREYLVDIDDKLKDLQLQIQEYKMNYLKS